MILQGLEGEPGQAGQPGHPGMPGLKGSKVSVPSRFLFSTSVAAAVFPVVHDFTQYHLTVTREPVLSNKET